MENFSLQQIETTLSNISFFSWAIVIITIPIAFTLNRVVFLNIFEIIHNRTKKNYIVLTIYPIRYAMFWIIVGIIFVLITTLLNFSDEEALIFNRLIILAFILAIFSYGRHFTKNLDEFFEILVSEDNKAFNQILPFIRFTLIALVWSFTLLTMLHSVFGVDITTWLAGLGILGLGISLAMQDTFRNLVGSIMIIADKPFKENDRIQFEGNDGFVEKIGIRSSSVRTLSGELVYVPNTKLADNIIKNITARPNFRRLITIGITYDTPVNKIKQAIRIIHDVLSQNDPNNAPIHLNKDLPPRVMFNEFGDFSLNILVFYWYTPSTNYWAYKEHAQYINLKIFEEFEKAEIEFAFPSQTLYLAGDNKRELIIKQLNSDVKKTN